MPSPTIVCVSANPAMDRRLRVHSLAVGDVNRALSAQGLAGGKAAHVAMSVRPLAVEPVWIGFLGGAIGEECARQLGTLGIRVTAISTESTTRVNLEIIDNKGRVTELLEPGCQPTVEERDKFLRACVRGMREEWKPAVLIISGSLPLGVGPNLYSSLIKAARNASARVFVDTSGEGLLESVKARPDFVKVNRAEAGVLVGRPVTTIQEVFHATREIMKRGAASAAITSGRQGLVWAEHKDGPFWHARPPRMIAASTVGCGDATLGGFAYAATQRMTGEAALSLAVACGAATCVAPAPGRIELETVQALLPKIRIRKLSF